MDKQEIIDFINSSDNLNELKEIQVELEKHINKLDSDYHPNISSLFVNKPSYEELSRMAEERSRHVHYTWVSPNGYLCDDDGMVLEKDW